MFERIKGILIRSTVPTLLIFLLVSHGGQSSTTITSLGSAFSTLAGFYLLTCVLGLISESLKWRLSVRMMTLFSLSYGVLTLGTGIELQVFSTIDPAVIALYFFNGLWHQAVYIFSVVYFFRPTLEEDFEIHFRQFWQQRRLPSWVLRISLAMMSYILLYFIVGAVAFQYTEPFYTSLASDLSLKIPPLEVILQTQVMRSLIYVLGLMSIIAGFMGSKRMLALLAGCALFMLGGLAPLLANNEWPPILRYYHMIEIFFQNFTAGLCMVYLLKPSTPRIVQPILSED